MDPTLYQAAESLHPSPWGGGVKVLLLTLGAGYKGPSISRLLPEVHVREL